MPMPVEYTWYSVSEVAEIFGVTTGRVRQILGREAPDRGTRIGRKFGHIWILSDSDLETLRTFIGQRKKRVDRR